MAPVCFEDGLQLRDFVNVRDVARANVLVMEDERANFGVFNVGGKRPVTVQDFARIMIKEFGSRLDPLVPGEYRLGDTRHTISDVSRLEALGWQPTVPVEQNVREYVAWMREQQTTDEFLKEADRIMRQQGVVRTTKGRDH
jgi:dTDP-L-rhamnose 4-epimerase